MKRELFPVDFLFYISDCVAYGTDLLSVLIRNGDSKLFLKLHDHLYGVQRICAQVSLEVSFVSYLSLFYAKLINDNSFNFCVNFCPNSILIK